jgi:hypothetical protein
MSSPFNLFALFGALPEESVERWSQRVAFGGKRIFGDKTLTRCGDSV